VFPQRNVLATTNETEFPALLAPGDHRPTERSCWHPMCTRTLHVAALTLGWSPPLFQAEVFGNYLGSFDPGLATGGPAYGEEGHG